MSSAPQFIRIVRTPPGEAPLWVREKWVGLELPLASGDYGPRHAYTSGVLSGPSNRLIALVRLLLGRLTVPIWLRRRGSDRSSHFSECGSRCRILVAPERTAIAARWAKVHVS